MPFPAAIAPWFSNHTDRIYVRKAGQMVQVETCNDLVNQERAFAKRAAYSLD